MTTSKSTITIRPVVPADAASLRELRLEAVANYPAAFAADYGITAAQSIEFWAERIIDNTVDDKGVICVATAEGQLIGMTGFLRGHWPKIRHSGVIWAYTSNRNGAACTLAEALLDECIAWAKAHSVVMVKLAAITTNTPAIRCYARCGFTIYGIEPKAICYDGVYYDELLMVKTI